jgi:hypothetical protein
VQDVTMPARRASVDCLPVVPLLLGYAARTPWFGQQDLYPTGKPLWSTFEDAVLA